MGMNIQVRRGAIAMVLAGALVFAPAAVATASAATPVTAAGSSASASTGVFARSFANCTALNRVYKGGVAKAGVKYNRVKGKNKAFTVRPTFSTKLYNANRTKDRDKDGIACEKG